MTGTSRKRVRTNTTRTDQMLLAQAGNLEVGLVVMEPEGEKTEADGTVVVFEPEVEGIPDVLLKLHMGPTYSQGRQLALNMSAMTEQELLCLRDAMNAVIETMLPVCRELDEIAAKEAGSVDAPTNRRNYRPVPSLRFGHGEVRTYVEGVPGGSAGVPELVWPGGSRPRPTGDTGAAVADGELEPGSGSGDDQTATSESA